AVWPERSTDLNEHARNVIHLVQGVERHRKINALRLQWENFRERSDPVKSWLLRPRADPHNAVHLTRQRKNSCSSVGCREKCRSCLETPLDGRESICKILCSALHQKRCACIGDFQRAPLACLQGFNIKNRFHRGTPSPVRYMVTAGWDVSWLKQRFSSRV